MPRMPTFEEIRDDFERGIRTVEQAVEHPFQRHPDAPAQGANPYTQAPAQQPVNLAAATAAAPQQEDTMSLSQIAADIKGAIDNADSWVKEVTETHLPAILAQAQKYENSPVVQALESAFLPPALEQQIANMITELSKTYPAPAPVITDPAPAGQQPVVQGVPAQ